MRRFRSCFSRCFWSARNRARRREPGDGLRAALFGGIGLVVAGALFAIAFWLTWQLLDYEELGDYLIRLGLGWLFLTFLSFVAFSAVVSALTTFFLSEDLRLLLPAPVPAARLFYSRFARTVGQAGWMVVAFVLPVLLGLGLARCAPLGYYVAAVLTVVPFVVIPAAVGTPRHARARERLPRPPRARRADADGPAVRGRAGADAALPEARAAAERPVPARPDGLLRDALVAASRRSCPPSGPARACSARCAASSTCCTLARSGRRPRALTVLTRAAYGRQYFAAWSKAQEARKARFTRLAFLEPALRLLPMAPARRALLVKDLKVFLRDTTQWSQLLLLVALALVYVYNFRVLDLDRIPYMSRLVKNAYAFVNLAMAAFVTAAVAVRFVFPAVSAEGSAFWIVQDRARLPLFLSVVQALDRARPDSACSPSCSRSRRTSCWASRRSSSCWARWRSAFMALALVGLACGMGAEHPRFGAENPTQIAGSYGGVAFMVLAVLYILTTVALLAWPASLYLWHDYRGLRIPPRLGLGLARPRSRPPPASASGPSGPPCGAACGRSRRLG